MRKSVAFVKAHQALLIVPGFPAKRDVPSGQVWCIRTGFDARVHERRRQRTQSYWRGILSSLTLHAGADGPRVDICSCQVEEPGV